MTLLTRPFSATGLAMLSELPPKLRSSYDYQAVIHAYAREVDLLEASIEQVRAQFVPSSADILLGAWESLVKLPLGGNGASISQRQANVVNRIQRLLGQAEGIQWIQTLNGILGPGWSYEEHNPVDGGSPAVNVIRVSVPFASGTPFFDTAEVQVRIATAGHLGLEFLSTAGFILDESELDQTEFGGN
jgi:hypothetical protein